MANSISCIGFSSKVDEEVNPYPLKSHKAEFKEDGSYKLVECKVVAPSIASDFQVLANAMYGRDVDLQYKHETDVTESDNFYSNLLDN